MSGNSNGMQDLGGGVSVFSSTVKQSKTDESGEEQKESEAAFRKLSAEIAEITEGVGDPMTVHPVNAASDPHLDYFLTKGK